MDYYNEFLEKYLTTAEAESLFLHSRLPETISAETCLKAVRKNALAFESVPEKYKTYELCVEAIVNKAYLSMLPYIPEKFKTEEFCLNCIKISGKHLPKQFHTQELWQAAVTKDGFQLKDLPPSFMTEKICLLAVTSYGKALEYVPKEFMTKEVCFAAVRQDREALKFTDVSLLSADEYTAICKVAITTTA